VEVTLGDGRAGGPLASGPERECTLSLSLCALANEVTCHHLLCFKLFAVARGECSHVHQRDWPVTSLPCVALVEFFDFFFAY
jgi:hypothetical protein